MQPVQMIIQIMNLWECADNPLNRPNVWIVNKFLEFRLENLLRQGFVKVVDDP